MRKKHWPGLLRLLELCHYDASGNLLSKQTDLPNILHQDGESFLLRAAFVGGQQSNVIPTFYYLGLDSRSTIANTDTMDQLIGEPTGSGYQRQQISSSGVFSLNLEQGHYLATSPIVAFRATTGSWGPVTNLFLTNTADNSGDLISSVVLTAPVSLNHGDAVTMRIGLQIKDC